MGAGRAGECVWREVQCLVSRCRRVLEEREGRWTTRSQSQTQAGRHDEADDDDSEEEEEEEEDVVCRLRAVGSCVQRRGERERRKEARSLQCVAQAIVSGEMRSALKSNANTLPRHGSTRGGGRKIERGRTTTMPRAWATHLPELVRGKETEGQSVSPNGWLATAFSNRVFVVLLLVRAKT